jgi:Protein of unknown function (DUF2793)
MADHASVTLGPKLGKVIYADIGASFPNSLRALLRALDQNIMATVKSRAIANPPGSPANGDAYIVAAAPTGAWAGQAGKIAVWSTQIATVDTNVKVPAWEFYTPLLGWSVYNEAESDYVYYDGAAWVMREQHARLTTGSVAAGTRADVVITLPSGYGNTSYNVQALMEDTSALGAGLKVERIRAKTTTQVTVQVINDAAGGLTGTVHLFTRHD